jgi:hypothetical protein
MPDSPLFNPLTGEYLKSPYKSRVQAHGIRMGISSDNTAYVYFNEGDLAYDRPSINFVEVVHRVGNGVLVAEGQRHVYVGPEIR